MMKKYAFALSAPLILAAFASPAFATQNCQAVGQETAASQNGKLVKVTPATGKDGKPACVVVVSVPSTNGEKPRRVELEVPADK